MFLRPWKLLSWLRFQFYLLIEYKGQFNKVAFSTKNKNIFIKVFRHHTVSMTFLIIKIV